MKSYIFKQLSTFLIILRIQQTGCQFSTGPTFGICLGSIFDSLYDRGYQPHYIQEDITDNEKADGEYLEFPDFNSSQESLGTLNHPSWLSYQKEVFFPPESEYKNINYPKNEKSNEKIAPLHNEPSKLTEDKWNSFLPPIIGPQELKKGIKVSLADSTKLNIPQNSSNLDFLIPIPGPQLSKGTEISRIIPESGQITLQPLNFSNSINNQEMISKTFTQVTKTDSHSKNLTSNNFTELIKPVSHSVNLQPAVESQSINVKTPEHLHLTNQNINSATVPQKMDVSLSNNIVEFNNLTSNALKLPITKNITLYEVEVSENSAANNSQSFDHKQTKKKKFSILSLFHKKNDRGNATIIGKPSEKRFKSNNIIIKHQLKNEKPNNLQELYSQLTNERKYTI